MGEHLNPFVMAKTEVKNSFEELTDSIGPQAV